MNFNIEKEPQQQVYNMRRGNDTKSVNPNPKKSRIFKYKRQENNHGSDGKLGLQTHNLAHHQNINQAPPTNSIGWPDSNVVGNSLGVGKQTEGISAAKSVGSQFSGSCPSTYKNYGTNPSISQSQRLSTFASERKKYNQATNNRVNILPVYHYKTQNKNFGKASVKISYDSPNPTHYFNPTVTYTPSSRQLQLNLGSPPRTQGSVSQSTPSFKIQQSNSKVDSEVKDNIFVQTNPNEHQQSQIKRQQASSNSAVENQFARNQNDRITKTKNPQIVFSSRLPNAPMAQSNENMMKEYKSNKMETHQYFSDQSYAPIDHVDQFGLPIFTNYINVGSYQDIHSLAKDQPVGGKPEAIPQKLQKEEKKIELQQKPYVYVFKTKPNSTTVTENNNSNYNVATTNRSYVSISEQTKAKDEGSIQENSRVFQSSTIQKSVPQPVYARVLYGKAIVNVNQNPINLKMHISTKQSDENTHKIKQSQSTNIVKKSIEYQPNRILGAPPKDEKWMRFPIKINCEPIKRQLIHDTISQSMGGENQLSNSHNQDLQNTIKYSENYNKAYQTKYPIQFRNQNIIESQEYTLPHYHNHLSYQSNLENSAPKKDNQPTKYEIKSNSLDFEASQSSTPLSLDRKLEEERCELSQIKRQTRQIQKQSELHKAGEPHIVSQFYSPSSPSFPFPTRRITIIHPQPVASYTQTRVLAPLTPTNAQYANPGTYTQLNMRTGSSSQNQLQNLTLSNNFGFNLQNVRLCSEIKLMDPLQFDFINYLHKRNPKQNSEFNNSNIDIKREQSTPNIKGVEQNYLLTFQPPRKPTILTNPKHSISTVKQPIQYSIYQSPKQLPFLQPTTPLNQDIILSQTLLPLENVKPFSCPNFGIPVFDSHEPHPHQQLKIEIPAQQNAARDSIQTQRRRSTKSRKNIFSMGKHKQRASSQSDFYWTPQKDQNQTNLFKSPSQKRKSQQQKQFKYEEHNYKVCVIPSARKQSNKFKQDKYEEMYQEYSESSNSQHFLCPKPKTLKNNLPKLNIKNDYKIEIQSKIKDENKSIPKQEDEQVSKRYHDAVPKEHVKRLDTLGLTINQLIQQKKEPQSKYEEWKILNQDNSPLPKYFDHKLSLSIKGDFKNTIRNPSPSGSTPPPEIVDQDFDQINDFSLSDIKEKQAIQSAANKFTEYLDLSSKKVSENGSQIKAPSIQINKQSPKIFGFTFLELFAVFALIFIGVAMVAYRALV